MHYLDEALRNAYYDGPMYSGISDNKADVYAEQGLLKPGAIFADNGFCSYTSNEDFARNWKDGLVICLKQGGKGCASVKSISKFPEEDEVLMARDTTLRVTAYDPKTRTLDVELVGNDAGTAKDSDNSGDDETEWLNMPTEQVPLLKRWEEDEPDFQPVKQG